VPSGLWDPVSMLTGLMLGTYGVISVNDPYASGWIQAEDTTLSCREARPEPPPPHAIKVVKGLSSTHGDHAAFRLAQILACRGAKAGNGGDAFKDTLLRAARSPSDNRKLADYAARALGATQPAGSEAVVAALLKAGDKRVLLNYAVGLRERAKGGFGDDTTRALAESLQTSPHGDVGAKAQGVIDVLDG